MVAGMDAADFAIRLVVVGMMTLGAVKIADFADWVAERKMEKPVRMVQRLVLPPDVHPFGATMLEEDFGHSLTDMEVWLDAPLYRGDIERARRYAPNAVWRVVDVHPLA